MDKLLYFVWFSLCSCTDRTWAIEAVCEPQYEIEAYLVSLGLKLRFFPLTCSSGCKKN